MGSLRSLLKLKDKKEEPSLCRARFEIILCNGGSFCLDWQQVPLDKVPSADQVMDSHFRYNKSKWYENLLDIPKEYDSLDYQYWDEVIGWLSAGIVADQKPRSYSGKP